MNNHPLYQQKIIDHAENPIGFPLVKKYDQQNIGFNQSCGDKVVVQIVQKGSKLKLYCQTDGCAICTASGSMMVNELNNKTKDEIIRISLIAHQIITKTELPNYDGDLLSLQSIRLYPNRVRCALLPWETLGEMIDER